MTDPIPFHPDPTAAPVDPYSGSVESTLPEVPEQDGPPTVPDIPAWTDPLPAVPGNQETLGKPGAPPAVPDAAAGQDAQPAVPSGDGSQPPILAYGDPQPGAPGTTTFADALPTVSPIPVPGSPAGAGAPPYGQLPPYGDADRPSTVPGVAAYQPPGSYTMPPAGPYPGGVAPYPGGVAPMSTPAVWALVCGIVGVCFGWLSFELLPLAAIVCGHVGLRQTRRGFRRGRGLAIAGLTLGYLALAWQILVVDHNIFRW